MKNIKLQELKRYLKSQLKNKISINSKTIIAFLIMGFMGLSTISFSRWDYIRIEDNKIRPDGNNITQPSEGSILLTDNNSSNNMKYAIVIGYGVDNLKTKIEASTTQPVKSVAIGIGAQVLMDPFNFRSNEAGEGHQGVALGSNAVTTDQGVAVGNDVYAVGRSSIAIGSDDNQKYQNKITKHDFDNYFKILYKGIDSTGTVYGYDVNGNTPNGHESNKVFSPTLAKGDGSISIGSRALAFDEGTTALGTFAFALKKGATAIGTLSRAEGQGAIAFGRESKVFSNNTIGAGNEVQVLKDGGAAFGYRAYSGGEGSIALGTEVYANSEIDTTAIKQIVNGTNLNKRVNPFTILKQDLNGIAKSAATNKILKSGEYFGQSGKGYLEEVEKIISQDIITRKTEKFNDVEGVSKTKGNHSIVIGSKAIASNDNSVALGRGSFSLEKNAMALGSYSYSDSENAIAIGVASKGLGKNSIAIGVGTGVGKGEKENNKDYGKNSLAIGTGSYTSGNNSSLIGTDSRVWSDNSGSFGSYNDVSGVNNLALGNGIFILNNKIEEGATKDTNDIIRKRDIVLSNYKLLIPTRNNVALGNAITIANGVRNSLVLGTNSSIGDEKIDNNDITDSMVLGNGASVIADVKKGDNFKGNQAMAIGALAVATLNNSIALGHSSKTDYSVEDLEKEGWMPKGILSVPSSTKVGILSVGSKGAERRIANVAAGYRETDAVNVSQLRAIEEKLSQTGMIDDDSFEDNVHYISINKKGSDLNKIEALKQREIDYKEYIQYKSRQLEIKVREKRGDNINNGYKSKVNKKVTELEAKSANKAIQQSKLKAVTIQTNSSNFDYEAEMNKIYEAKNSDINNKKNLFEDAERTEMNASNFNNEGAVGIDSIAIGAYAKSTGNQAVSIGKNATAGEGSVAIGSSSIAKEDKSVSYLTNVANTDGRTFSVGSDTVKRRLKNLADGSADSDAVTVAQLKSVGNIKFQGDSGSESTFDITKRIEVKGSTAQKANNGGAETWGQGDAKHTVENIQTFTSKNGDTQKILIGMKDKPRFSEIKLGNSSEINLRVSNDGNLAINSKKLTGLASATADSDAVAYGQVKVPFKIGADNNTSKDVNLGETFDITGRKGDNTNEVWTVSNVDAKNGRYVTDNIETFVNRNGSRTRVLIGLKENPKFKATTVTTLSVGETNDAPQLSKDNSGNLLLNSKKLTGLASATADSDAVTYGQVKNGFKVEADNASDKNIGLGKILEITGRKIDGTASFDAWSINNLEGKNGRYSSENIETFVSQDTTGKTSVLIGLKENPRFTEIQIGDKDKNLKIKQIEEKFNFSDKGISGVATGQINSTSNDVVVGSQLNDYVKEIASNGDITVSAKQNVTGGGQKYTLSLSESLKNKINSLTDVDTKVKGATEKVVNADDYITVNEENGINGLGKTFKVGLAQKTKTKIDNALDKALSTIDADGKKVIKSLVNVTKDTLTNGDENILNVTTENDNTSNENAKNYKLSVSKAKVKEIVSAEIAGYKVEANTDSPITVANEGKKVKLGLDKAKAVEILSKDADIDTPKVGNSSLVTDSQVHIAVEKAKENVVAKADSSIEVTPTNGSNGKGTTYTVGLKQEVEDKLKNIGNMDAYAKLDGTNLNDQKFDKNIWSNALGTDNITNPTVGNGSLVTEKAVINYVKEQGINFETDNQAKQLVKLGETIDFSSKTGNNKNDIETWDFGTGSDKTHSTANVSTKYETKDNKKHLLIGIKENPTFKNVVADSLVFGSENTDPKLSKTNEGNLQLNNKKLTGLVDGTIDTDAATVAQVNSAKENVLGTTDYIKVTEGTNGKAKTFTVDLEESVKNKLNNIGEGKVEESDQNTVKGNVVYSAIKDARTKVKLENIQNDKNYLTLTESPENNENSISARTYTLGLNKSELKKDFVEKNADNLDDSNVQAWKTKLGITKGSVEEVEASTDSPIIVNSEATTDGKKFTLTLDKAKAVTALSKDANIDNPNTNNSSLVTDSQVHTAVEKAKENVVAKADSSIEVTPTNGSNGKGTTYTVGLKQEVEDKLKNIGAGEVVANNANTVSGGKIFTAITNAKTKVDKADNEEIVTVTKNETSDINSNTYKIGVNKEKITELIDVVAKTAEAGKEQMLEVESKVDNITKKKTFTVSLSDASLNKIDNALDKTTAETTYAKVALDNITDAGKKVIKDLVNVEAKISQNGDENILTVENNNPQNNETKTYSISLNKSKVQGIAKDTIIVNSDSTSGIKVEEDKTNSDDKKKTYKLSLDEAKIKELAGTTDVNTTFAKVDASNMDKLTDVNKKAWAKIGTDKIEETSKDMLVTDTAVKSYLNSKKKNIEASNGSMISVSNGEGKVLGDSNVTLDLTETAKNMINNSVSKDASNLDETNRDKWIELLGTKAIDPTAGQAGNISPGKLITEAAFNNFERQFAGDEANKLVKRKASEILNIKGGATGTVTDSNIKVEKEGNDTLKVKLSSNLSDIESLTLKANDNNLKLKNKDGNLALVDKQNVEKTLATTEQLKFKYKSSTGLTEADKMERTLDLTATNKVIDFKAGTNLTSKTTDGAIEYGLKSDLVDITSISGKASDKSKITFGDNNLQLTHNGATLKVEEVDKKVKLSGLKEVEITDTNYGKEEGVVATEKEVKAAMNAATEEVVGKASEIDVTSEAVNEKGKKYTVSLNKTLKDKIDNALQTGAAEKKYAKVDGSNLTDTTFNKDNWTNALGVEGINENITENGGKGYLTTEKAVKEYVAKQGIKFTTDNQTNKEVLLGQTIDILGKNGVNSEAKTWKQGITNQQSDYSTENVSTYYNEENGKKQIFVGIKENPTFKNVVVNSLAFGSTDADPKLSKTTDNNLILNDKKLTGLSKGTENKDAINKEQFDEELGKKVNSTLSNITEDGKKVVKKLVNVTKETIAANNDENILNLTTENDNNTNGDSKEYKLSVKKSKVQEIAKETVEVTTENNSGLKVETDKTTNANKVIYKLALDTDKIKELVGTTNIDKTYAKVDGSNITDLDETKKENWATGIGTKTVEDKDVLVTSKAVKTYVDGKGLKFSTNKIGDEINVNLGQTLAIKGEEDDAIAKETTFESAKGNVYIEKNGEQGLVVKLAKKLKNIESIELKKGDKASNITINDSGNVTVNGNEIITTGNISNQTIGYKANNTNVKTVKLSEGFNFTSGTNTEAVVEDNGVVKFNLKDELTNIKSISGLTEKTVDDMYGTTDGEAATRKEVKTVYNKLKDNNKEQAKLKNGTLGTLVYTDKDGNKLMKDTDGKFYKAKADGTKEENAQEVVSENVILSTVKPDGKTTEPITLGNVASALGLSNDNKKNGEILNKLVNKKAEASMNYTEIELNKVVTLRDLQFLASKGITFAGSTGTATKFLGDTITINGTASNYNGLDNNNFATKYETKNIAVKVDNNTGNIEVGLAKELKAIESIENKETKVTLTEKGTEFKTGTDGVTTKIDKEGIKITKGDKILSIKATEKGGSITGIEEKIVDENYGTTEGEVATRKEVKSVYNKLITVEEKVKQVDKGLKFAGNSGEIKEHKLGDTITIKGEGTEANNFESAKGNINVKAEKDSLNLQLASKLKNMESFETKEDKDGNKTILNQDSLTFGNKKGKITGVVTGIEDDSAVNKKYVDEKFANNPFEYYTKEGNIKVVKDKNGKFHKETLDGEEVEANSVVIKAEPEAMVLGNIANGIEAKDSKEAVNGGQLYNKANKDASNIEVDKYIEKLSEKANIAKPKENLVTDKQVHDYLNGYYNKGEVDEKVKNIEGQAKEALGGVSNAVAMANLVQVNSYSDFRNNISAAYGYYGKQHALAIGLSGVTENRRVVYRASGSVNTSGNLALGVGLGVMLGDKESRMKYPEKSQKVKELEEINKKQDAEIKNLKDKVSLFEKENKEIKEMLMKLLEQKK
ncbi:YadA-like family protein [Sneathia sanguinegens]|uniref:YadA-like family protein n=1 Tax=Sneathia sanguinegens TaxID=40543 RepID=UPI0023F877D5|nr:YadA-like family protein [Sneathia sanguinegens]